MVPHTPPRLPSLRVVSDNGLTDAALLSDLHALDPALQLQIRQFVRTAARHRRMLQSSSRGVASPDVAVRAPLRTL